MGLVAPSGWDQGSHRKAADTPAAGSRVEPCPRRAPEAVEGREAELLGGGMADSQPPLCRPRPSPGLCEATLTLFISHKCSVLSWSRACTVPGIGSQLFPLVQCDLGDVP